MKIKILQLNCFMFKYFPEMVSLINELKPDIVNLQELASGQLLKNRQVKDYWSLLQEQTGMTGVLAKRFELDDEYSSYFGNGVLSRYNILDYRIDFDPSLPSYTTYQDDSDLAQTVIHNQKDKYYAVFDMPVNYLQTIINFDGKIVRNMTTHFNVSYNCQEVRSHIQSTRNLLKILKHSKNLPTIISGDLNIHPKSSTLTILGKELDVKTNIQNTLNPVVHPAILNQSLPEGAQVDYVFSKNIKQVNCQALPDLISDYLALWAEFEI